MKLFYFRQCEKCQRAFATERGLESHVNRLRNSSTQCGTYAMLKKREKQRHFLTERKKTINGEKYGGKLRPLKPHILKGRKGPMTKDEKELALRMYDIYIAEFKYKRSKAVEVTAKLLARSKKMIYNILKEYNNCGEVFGGPYYKNIPSNFDRLTIEQRDLFRTVVHNEMSKCKKNDPLFEEDAKYPTVASIHKAITEKMTEVMPFRKWSQSTTYRILKQLGFLNLENKDIHYGLLIEDKYTVARRGHVCLQLLRLWAEGYYLIFEDESFVTVCHSPKKKWHDTTVQTAKQAKDQGLSTGNIKPPGRGERLILIGAGGIDGWEGKDVILRSEGTGNDIEYKNDLKKEKAKGKGKINMDSSRFEQFVHKIAKRVTKRHKKVAWVMDNASYHNQYREDIPRSGWSVARIKAFCKENNLEIIVKKGKRGKPVKQDYMDAVNLYVETADVVFSVDIILKSYGIIGIRLPPYHPELNAMERP